MSAEERGDPRPLSWGERESKRRARQRSHRASGAERVWTRSMSRLRRLMRSLGLSRRRIEVGGVVYRELSGVSLRRALGETGPGVKEYEVRFPLPGRGLRSAQYPHREEMRIRFTARRRFADLGHDPRVRFVHAMRDVVRPGQRVLDLGCGTGAGSAQLASAVGPSGGVVAINRDGESIRFARQRYRADHLAFELGWLDTLSGELDGAFDVVVAVDLFRDAPDDPGKSRAVSELWRVVRRGGWVLLVCSDPSEIESYEDRLGGLGGERVERVDPDPVLGWAAVRGEKPEPTRGSRDGGDA
ncbi:MAG: methyltransferase domain-containing protein [Phycisphaerales bacterium]|nr:methyltransferase domain-containing protein [Phycisphaerales bacterium]